MDPDVIKVLTYLTAAAVVGLYVAFVMWRIRVDRQKKAAAEQATGAPGAPPRPAAKPARQSRAERKAAAIAGTTPVTRPDLAESEARVLAAAARIAGREAGEAPGDQEPSTPTPPTAATAAAAAPPAPPTTASLFRPAAATPAPVPADERTTSVAELLKGIVLPCDLAPVTDMAPRMSTLDRVAFSTRSATAEVVAPAMASELERLGFTVTPDGYESVVLARGADRGVVMVHPKAEEAVIDGVPAFPAIPPGTVVVEVWIPAGAL